MQGFDLLVLFKTIHSFWNFYFVICMQSIHICAAYKLMHHLIICNTLLQEMQHYAIKD